MYKPTLGTKKAKRDKGTLFSKKYFRLYVELNLESAHSHPNALPHLS